MTTVTIGIPTYNGSKRLDWLLKSIAMRTPELAVGSETKVGITVVDDGSPRVSATRDVIERHSLNFAGSLPIKYIEHGSNRGIPAGWNSCARSFDVDIVVLINDDVIVSSDWLRPLVHVLEHSPNVGAVSTGIHWFLEEDVPGLLASPTSDRGVTPRDPQYQHAPERRAQFEDCNPGRVMCPTGCLFAFRRADFDMVGGFDESIKSFFEESMFGTELAARGFITAAINHPHCYHMWSQTFKENSELNSHARMEHARDRYRARWEIPGHIERGKEFDYTNPKYMQAIGDVPIEWIRQSGEIEKGVLRRDGAYVKS